MDNYLEFRSRAERDLKRFDGDTRDFKFLEKLSPDHLCYKCQSREEYQKIMSFLESESQFIYSSMISRRMISLISLKQPLSCSIGDIFYIELSDQKPENNQKGNFDHIEFLPRDIDYDDLVAIPVESGLDVIEKRRPHHTTHEIVLEGDIKLVFTREKLVEKVIGEIRESI